MHGKPYIIFEWLPPFISLYPILVIVVSHPTRYFVSCRTEPNRLSHTGLQGIILLMRHKHSPTLKFPSTHVTVLLTRSSEHRYADFFKKRPSTRENTSYLKMKVIVNVDCSKSRSCLTTSYLNNYGVSNSCLSQFQSVSIDCDLKIDISKI